MSDKYNGYTNYETFLVAVWVQEEQEYYMHLAGYFCNDQREVAKAIKQKHYKQIPESNNIYSALITASLENVDWMDVADIIVNWETEEPAI